LDGGFILLTVNFNFDDGAGLTITLFNVAFSDLDSTDFIF